MVFMSDDNFSSQFEKNEVNEDNFKFSIAITILQHTVGKL